MSEYKFKVGDRVIIKKLETTGEEYVRVGMIGTVIENNSRRPWIEFTEKTGFDYYGGLTDKKEYVYCVWQDELELIKDFEVGDTVRIRKKCTIEELAENHWHGCKSDTLKFLNIGGSETNEFVVERLCGDNDVEINDCIVNGNLLELVKKKETVKEMTLKEVCDALGYEVKIIKEEK